MGIDVDDSRIADGFEPKFPDMPIPAGVTSVYSFPGGNDTLPGAGANERLVTGDLFIDDFETLTITADMTIVVKNVDFLGDYDYHYDENLKSIVGDNPTYASDFSRNY